jgi:hypothetical protein
VAKTIKVVQDAKGLEKALSLWRGNCQKMRPSGKIREGGEATVQRRKN